MKKPIILLLLSNTTDVLATGIMMPSGIGTAIFNQLVIPATLFFITMFILYNIYNHSKNKARTKKYYIRIFVGLFLIYLFVFQIVKPGYVTFTRYTIIDNNLFSDSLKINIQHSSSYFKLSDGYAYEIKMNSNGKHSRQITSLKSGQLILLSKGKNNNYTIHGGKQNTKEYWQYLASTKKAVLTISFSFKKIHKNQLKYKLEVKRIEGDWTANRIHLERTLNTNNCCNILWIKELLKHNVNKFNVINKKDLLHNIFSLQGKPYLKYRTEILSLLFNEPDVNVNQRNSSKQTLLHHAVLKTTDNGTVNKSDRDFIQFLLDAGINQNLSDDQHETPLKLALKGNKLQLAHLLVENGANYNIGRNTKNGSAREIVQRKLQESKANKNKQKNLILLLEAMNTGNLQKKTKKPKSNILTLNKIKQDCTILGKSWENAYGIKVDNLYNLSKLSKQEQQQVKPMQKPFLKLGIISLADYTCNKKSTPLNTVTVKVFVFENSKRAIEWWQKKYQYKDWEKHYTQVTDVLYKAVDSKQLTKRSMVVNNLWITTHHLHDGNEHLILLEKVLRQLSLDQMVKLNTQ